MISKLWQLLSCAADVNSHIRTLQGRSVVDVVFITNMRDEVDRKRFLGRSKPATGHFNGPRISIKGINARVRSIDSTAEEMLTTQGRRRAKQQFIAATRWAEQHGAKVILLAASTKRLFGRNGREIQEMFPDLVFTIGDNGTALVLLQEVFNQIKTASIDKAEGRVLVIGPYGILGSAVIDGLVHSGYQVIGMGGNKAGLQTIHEKYQIPVHETFNDISGVDLVIACTHSKDAMLTAKTVAQIKRPNSKLHVIDVAEPSNLTADEYRKCADKVIRQDAGNAYSKHLNYVLGYFSYKLFRLSQGVVFGCFAEALSLFYALEFENNEKVSKLNHFHVDADGMSLVASYYDTLGFTTPKPRNYGTRI